MKKLAILITILLSCSQASSEQKKVIGSPTSAPISLPQKVAPKSQKQKVAGEEFKTEAQKALELKYQYIDPYLSNILSKKVHCEKLIDDDESFTALQDIFQGNESYTSFIRDEKYEDVRNARPIVEFITPELEKKYQETSEGHICFSWPNQYTVKSLYEVWEKSHCSEAGVLALLQIDYILYHAYTDQYTSIYPEGPHPPLGGIEHILQYIIDSYPGSWQAENARLRMSARKIGKKKYPPDISSEWITAFERWVNFVENNDVLTNKYYIFHAGTNDPTGHFQRDVLDQLGILYAEKCKEVAIKGINENGKITAEAIEMYNKNLELWKSIKNKHPQFYNRKVMTQYSRSKARECYDLIERYAPEQVKHKKEDLE